MSILLGLHHLIDVRANASMSILRGLGIGTTPTALIAHGIDTTIVEIDSTVHDFASRYFNLPSNHTPIIEDAIAFVERNRRKKKYEYIIHDVFTGGAEPIDLFTVEFLTGLKQMLTVDGVIAIVRYLLLHLPPPKALSWHTKSFLIKVLICNRTMPATCTFPPPALSSSLSSPSFPNAAFSANPPSLPLLLKQISQTSSFSAAEPPAHSHSGSPPKRIS